MHITHHSVNCIYHVVHYIPNTYLSYNWKFVPFDYSSPLPSSYLQQPQSDLFFWVSFWSVTDLCACTCSVIPSRPTLCNSMNCCLPGSSVPGIFQARILGWLAISSSRGSSRFRDQIHISCISCIDRQIFFFFFLPLSHLES